MISYHYLCLMVITLLLVVGCAINKKTANSENPAIQQLDVLDQEKGKVALFKKLGSDLRSMNSIEKIEPYLD